MKQILTICVLLLATVVAQGAERRAINQLPNADKLIALTFDDGPNAKFTQPILDILAKHEMQATFFQVGKNMKRLPELSRKVSAAGHEIGNHSMTHARLPELATAEGVKMEIAGFQTLTQETTGNAPKVFRAPYLKFDDRVWAVIDELGLPAFNASVYADYKGDGDLSDPAIASAHAQGVVEKVKGGTIILMHERAKTLHYLDEVVGTLKANGYTFVTLSELLAAAPSP
jgi:peptidoglycan/xylan/chitin deacetylase (PgdA/CDA1 family)